jgi:hypothetical protein
VVMWRRVILTALLTATGTSDAGATVITGNELYAQCTDVTPPYNIFLCYGYIAGVADAMEGSPINLFSACIPIDVTVPQLHDIVVRSLYEHAGERHVAAKGLVAEALSKAFPCAH